MARGVPKPGDLVGGRYLLEEKLGEGGMAVVFRAQHTGTERACALKFVQPHLVKHKKTIELFLKEAKVAGRIGSHPHIVDVLDSGFDEQSGVPFIAMELLEGKPLDEILEQHGPIEAEQACVLLEQLGEALDEAHRSGVIHRDLKPANIFITRDHKGQEQLKVMDFGIAKIVDHTTGGTATQVGTPAYAAPEQLGKGVRKLAADKGVTIAVGVSPQTDVWALGFVAYEMLTAIDPGSYWDVDTYADLIVQVALDEGPLPSKHAGPELAARLPERFDDWFRSCTRRNSVERWAGFGVAVSELLALLRRSGQQSASQTLLLDTSEDSKPQPPRIDTTTPLPEPELAATAPEAPVVRSKDTHDPWQTPQNEATEPPRGGMSARPAAGLILLVVALAGGAYWATQSSPVSDASPSAAPEATAQLPTSGTSPTATAAATPTPTVTASATTYATAAAPTASASSANRRPMPFPRRPAPIVPKVNPPGPEPTAPLPTPKPQTDDDIMSRQH